MRTMMLINSINANVVNAHGVVLCFWVPGGQPVHSFLPEWTHLNWIRYFPWFFKWLVERLVDAPIWKHVATNRNIQDKMKLKIPPIHIIDVKQL